VRVLPDGEGAFTTAAAASITMLTDGNAQIIGAIAADKGDGQVSLTSNGLMYLGGLVSAQSQLTVVGGNHSSGVGLLVRGVTATSQSGWDGAGQLSTAAGGSITLRSADAIQIDGRVGITSTVDSVTRAVTKSIEIGVGSTDVTINGTVDAADRITVNGGDVTVNAGGRVRTWATGSELRMRAADTLLVAAANGSLNPGQVRADALVHLMAGRLWMAGTVQLDAATGDALLSASSSVTVTGNIETEDRIDIQSGVDLSGTALATVEAGIAVASLTGGTITLQSQGVLSTPGAVSLRAGGDVTVSADASVSGTRTVSTPVVVTKQRTVQIQTGTRDVAVGTINVSEVTWVDTDVTEQVGTEQVQVGTEYHTLDATLTQIGYFNAAGGTFREYFIEGQDYSNDDIDWVGISAKLGITVVAPSGDYTSADYKQFHELTNDQQAVVLAALGYMPLYEFTYANAQTTRTINGVTTSSAWTPDWASNSQVIYRVDVDGWRDRFIRMPEGSQADVLRVVSQGETKYLTGDNTLDGSNSGGSFVTADQLPSTGSGELVAQYQDTASLDYTQEGSTLVGATTNTGAAAHTTTNAYTGTTTTADVGSNWGDRLEVVDDDSTGAYWEATYQEDTGSRIFTVVSTDAVLGSGNVTLERDPEWMYARNDNGTTQMTDPLAGQSTASRDTSQVLIQRSYADALVNDTASLVITGATTDEDVVVGHYAYWDQWVHLFEDEQDDDNESGVRDDNIDDEDYPKFGPTLFDGLQGLKDAMYSGFSLFDWITSPRFHNRPDLPADYDQYKVEGWVDYDTFLGIVTGDSHFFDISARNKILVDITEDQHDYTYAWTSTAKDVRVQRTQQTYQVVTNSTAIYDYRAVYETNTTQVAVEQTRTLTKYEQEAVLSPQTELYSERNLVDGGLRPSASFGANSITAGSITIETAGNANISGILEATTGSLTVTTTGDLGVEGVIPDGAASDTLASQSKLIAKDQVTLTVGGDLDLAESSLLTTTAVAGNITVNATGDAALGGEIETQLTVTVKAGSDITLGGTVLAENSVSISAGDSSLSPGGFGSITGDVTADIRATASGGDVVMQTGQYGGNIRLDGSLLLAQDTVQLTAQAGTIVATTTGETGITVSQADSGTVIDARVLQATAERGIAVGTEVDYLDLTLTSAGDIVVGEADDVTLRSVSAADGAITATINGRATVASVRTLGTSDRNDITITTRHVGDVDNEITLSASGTLSAGGQGDITLDAWGVITNNANDIKADNLTLTAQDDINVKTDVASLSVTTNAAANVSIRQAATDLLLNQASILNGSLTVTAGADIELVDVRLRTNADANDVTVTAQGDIGVRSIIAGVYATASADVPSAGGGADSGVTSLGDVTLTSTTGAITETYTDTAVDLVADRLTLSAATGITGLELAVNTLASIRTTSGDITLSDVDGVGERTPGLRVENVATALTGGDTVSITAANALMVGSTSATAPAITGDKISLTSSDGNVQVVQPASGDALSYTSSISFDAGQVLQLYRFFEAPETVSYRAGSYFDFDLPTSITSNNIILDTGSILTFDGVLTAGDRLELASGTNVFVSGDIRAIGGGTIDELIIRASGDQSISRAVDTNAAGLGALTLASSDTGFINLQVTGIDATNFELRAKQDIFVDTVDDLTLTGFIGGLDGFDPARNVTLDTEGTLSVLGGIVSANTTDGIITLRADAISTATSAVFIAQGLDAQATGAISLNTLVDELWATSTDSGDITVNESDDIDLRTVKANDGGISVLAGGTLNAHNVWSVVDAAANAISLRTTGDMFVDRVEAGEAAGAEKQHAGVTLDAAGTIAEMADYDNSAVDVAGRTVTILGTTTAAPVLATTTNGFGTGSELEILYTAATGGLVTGATTVDSTPTIPTSGDVRLVLPDRTAGPLTLSANDGGSLTIIDLATHDGDDLTLSADDDLVVVVPLDVGDGDITLSATNDLTLGGKVTAGDLTVTAGGNLTMTTAVDNLTATVNNGANLTVFQTGDLVIDQLNLSGGDVTISASGTVTINNITGNAGTVRITTSSGDIIITALPGAGVVVLNAAGGVNATLEADNLSITASGAITIVESDGVVIDSITQNASGAAVDIRTTSGNLTVNGALDTTGGAAISLRSGGTGNLSLNQTISTSGGTVSLIAGGNLSISAEGDISTSGGAVSLTASGSITLTHETYVDAGSGEIDVVGGGNVSIGKLRTTTTGEVEVRSTGGAVLDAGDSPPDIDAGNALVIINAVDGIGTSGTLEINAGTLRISNTGSGIIALEEVDGVEIEQLTQGGSGAVTITTLAGRITISGAVSTQAGALTLTAGSATTGGIVVDGDITTAGGAVTLTAQSGDITLKDSIQVNGAGAITLAADAGSILVDQASAGWRTSGGSFDALIETNLANGTFDVDVVTGTITIARNVDSSLNGTVLREATAPYIRTTGGALTLKAKAAIGAIVDGFTFSPLSLVVDAQSVSAQSSDRDVVKVLTLSGTAVGGSGANGSRAGATNVSSLGGGTVTVDKAIDGAGENVVLQGDDFDIQDTLRSVGADLVIRPRETDRTIVIGDITTVPGSSLQVDNTEIGEIADGFDHIIFGSDQGAHTILIGDSSVTGDSVTFTSDLVLKTPQDGGEVHVDADLVGTKSSLQIFGSGHTVHLDANITQDVNVEIQDSIAVTGNRTISAGGDITIGTSGDYLLRGNGTDGGDYLTLTAGAAGDITIGSTVGDSANLLSGLSITRADDVTFQRAVTVDGDLTINATGDVVFSEAVVVTGKLTIQGAASVTFAKGLTVQGDIFVAADEIDFNGGVGSVKTSGTGSITLRTATLSNNIEIGQVDGSVTDNTLNLTATDMRALADGFTQLFIGHGDMDTALLESGNVKIGAVRGGESIFHDSTLIRGQNIEVTDLTTASLILRTDDDLALEAYRNITIKNTILVGAEGDETHSLRLYSAAGTIRQQDNATDSQASEAIEAHDLQVRAPEGISLGFLKVDRVDVSGIGEGDIKLNQLAAGGDIDIYSITQYSLTATADITLTAENGIIHVLDRTSQPTVRALGGGNVTLTSTLQDLVVDGAISTVSGDIKLAGGTGVIINDQVTTAENAAITVTGAAVGVTSTIASNGGLVTVKATAGDISMTGDALIRSLDGVSDDGTVTLTASRNIRLTVVEADGETRITATDGSISDNLAGEAANLRGATDLVVLSAGRGVGTAAEDIDTEIDQLSAKVSSDGGLYVQEVDGLIIESDGVSIAGAGGNVVIRTQDGALSVVGDVITRGATGNIRLEAREQVEATDADLSVDASVTSSKGDTSLLTDDSLTLISGAQVVNSSAGSSIDMQASGDITMGATVSVRATDGRILVDAGNGVTLGGLEAGSGEIGIIARQGNILDTAAAGDTGINLSADDVSLVASGRIGGYGNHIETSAGTLTAYTDGGAIFISETDALTIGAVTVDVDRVGIDGTTSTHTDKTRSDVEIAGGHGWLVIQAGGGITVTDGADADRVGIKLGSDGSALLVAGADDLVLSSGVTLSGGDLTLIASQGDVRQGATGDIRVTGTGTVDVQAGEDIIMADGPMGSGAQTLTDGGNIRYAAGGDIILGLLDTGSEDAGAISLSAGGSITDANGDYDNLRTGSLRISATGAGTGADLLESRVDILSAVVGSNGLYLQDATGLTLGTVSVSVNRVASTVSHSAIVDAAISDVTATAGGNIVLVANGDIVLADGADGDSQAVSVTAGGNIRLESVNGDVMVDNAVTAGSGAVTLVAGGDIVFAASGDVTLSDAGTISAEGGSVLLSNDTVLTTAGGTIALTARSGDVQLGRLDSGSAGRILVTASGSILDGDDGVDLTAGSAVLNANRIGSAGDVLELTVGALAVSSGSGGAFLRTTGAVTLARLETGVRRTGRDGVVVESSGVASGLSSNGGALVLTVAEGDLAIDGGINAAGGSSLLLSSLAGDVVVNSTLSLADGGSLSLSASGAVRQTATGDIAVTGGGTLDVSAGGDIVMAAGAESLAEGTGIRYAAGGSITLGLVGTGSEAAGTVSLLASGSVIDGNGTALNVTAASLRLVAGNGIGADDAVDLSVGTLAAQAGAGGMALLDISDLATGTVGAVVDRIGLDGSRGSVADAAISDLVASGAGGIRVQAGGTLTIADGADGDGVGVVADAGPVLLGAISGDLLVNSGVSLSGGDLSLQAGGVVRQSVAGALSVSGSGTVDVSADGGIIMEDGAVTRTGGGDIRYASTGDITLGLLQTSGTVSLVAGGSVLDGNGDAVNVRASALRVQAAGVGTAANLLETDIDRIAASIGTNGLYIADQGDLTVGAVSAQVGRVGTLSGVISLADAALSDITANGNIFLTAQGNLTLTDGADGDGYAVAITGGVLRLESQQGDIIQQARLSITDGTLVMLAARDLVVTGIDAAGSSNLHLEALAGNVRVEGSLNAGSGAVTLVAGGDVVFAASGDVTLSGTGTISAEGGSVLLSNDTVLTTAGGTIALTARSGDVQLGRLDSGSAGRILVTASGSILDGDDGVDLTAGSAVLNANRIGSAGDVLELTVGALAVSSGSGGAFLRTTGAVTLARLETGVRRTGRDGVVVESSGVASGLSSNGGALVLTVAEGDLAIDGGINAAGGSSLLLSSLAGDVVVNSTLSLADGGSLSLSASGAVRQTATGDIAVTGGGTLDVSAGGDIVMAAGAESLAEGTGIRYAAGGSITLGLVGTGSEAAGTVSLLASGSVIDGNGTALNVTAASLRLVAGNGIGADDAVDLSVGTLAAQAGAGGMALLDISDLATGTVGAVVDRIGLDGSRGSVADAAISDLVASGAGTVDVSADGDITLGLLQTSGAVSLVAGGSVLDGNGDAVNVRASALRVQAAGVGTAANPLETDIDRIAASIGTNGLYIADQGDLWLDAGNGFGGIQSAGAVQLQAAGSITLGGASVAAQGGLTLRSTGADLLLSGTADFTGVVGLLALDAARDLSLQDGVLDYAGTLSLKAGRDLLLAGSSRITVQGGDISASIGRDINMAGTAQIASQGGDIALQANGNILVTTIDASTGEAKAGWGNVQLFSTSGNITSAKQGGYNVLANGFNLIGRGMPYPATAETLLAGTLRADVARLHFSASGAEGAIGRLEQLPGMDQRYVVVRYTNGSSVPLLIGAVTRISVDAVQVRGAAGTGSPVRWIGESGQAADGTIDLRVYDPTAIEGISRIIRARGDEGSQRLADILRDRRDTIDLYRTATPDYLQALLAFQPDWISVADNPSRITVSSLLHDRQADLLDMDDDGSDQVLDLDGVSVADELALFQDMDDPLGDGFELTL
jgi:hypothetical protein